MYVSLPAVLHVAKYFDCHVGGYLVGTVDRDEDRKTTVHISDAIPLLHSQPVGPIFEIGADFQKKQTIVGYYYCNEAVNDEKSPYYIDALSANQSDSGNDFLVVVRLNSANLLDGTKICFENNKINISTVSGDTVEAITSSISELLSNNRHQQLSDVEELLSSSTELSILHTNNEELTNAIKK